MMKKEASKDIAIIFPHQLFEESPLPCMDCKVYLIEEYLFFRQYPFHQQKLAFHRASMKKYEQFLIASGIEVHYIESHEEDADIRKFMSNAPEQGQTLHVIDPVDNFLERRIREASRKRGIVLQLYDNPSFINTKSDLQRFFNRPKKKFFQTDFYTQQRKSLGILLDEAGKPQGGKWTFDAENRKKYPKKNTPPPIIYPDADSIYREAVQYVTRYFNSCPGEVSNQSLYPTDFSKAKDWLQQFLAHRFSLFGDYEDAIVPRESILHHSVLSPLLNVGLLTPGYVVDEILAYAAEHQIAINNTEGIIRQIIGWREFIRGVYETKGTEERTKNFWQFDRKIPKSFYTGETGIPPVDITIKKLLKTAYNHHIERLMVLGNFMVLCEFDPDDVYRWFMELYIDSYDWVMVPNVYGMSQFADGGLMSTKPYISGSNYLMKMGHFEKGPWQAIWDGLFWRFMHVHRDFFQKNPRLKMLVTSFDKMDEQKRTQHLDTAEQFLNSL